MRVVVTGAAGFIGSRCLRMLRARGHEAIGLVRPHSTSRRLGELEEEFRLHHVDLMDRDALLSTLRGIEPDSVIHAAWYVEPRLYLHDVDRNIASLQASLSLLVAALDVGVARIVLVGSCLEGVRDGADSIYASTKRSLHDVALSSAVQARAAVACAHVFSPYGPDEHPTRAVASVIQALLRSDSIAVSSGTSRRDYIHISDVATALAALAESSIGGTVDVCTGQSVGLRDVFSTIASEIGRPDLLQWGQAEVGPGESFDAVGDPTRLLALGWTPQFDLVTGVQDAVAWWRSQSALTRGNH